MEIEAGQLYGAWEVIRLASDGRYLCLCKSCNETQKRVKKHDLLSGKSLQCKSCSSSTKRAHGGHQEHSSEYQSWQSMIARCTNKNNKDYPNYGGRGITVCQMWLDSFEAFFMCMGSKPSPEHTIERIDYNKGYEPKNCKWATRTEQNQNKSDNVLLTIDGETKTVREWSRHPDCTVTEFVIYKRLKRGGKWSDAKKAVFEPSRRKEAKEQPSQGTPSGESPGEEVRDVVGE